MAATGDPRYLAHIRRLAGIPPADPVARRAAKPRGSLADLARLKANPPHR